MLSLIEKLNQKIFIPLSVGGGITNLEDATAILQAGAEKISLGTAAIKHPSLISKIAQRFGSQAVIISLDIKQVTPHSKVPSGFEIYIYGGRTRTNLDALIQAQKFEKLGAGDILLNSIDLDGMRSGFNTRA